jgi:hypothetical protein
MSSSFALISGVLHAKPSPWTANKSKHDIVSFKLRVGGAGTFDVWECTVFEKSAREEIIALAKGDAVAAVGAFTTEVAEYGGKPRVKHRLNVSRLLMLETRPTARRNTEETPYDNEADYSGELPDWIRGP